MLYNRVGRPVLVRRRVGFTHGMNTSFSSRMVTKIVRRLLRTHPAEVFGIIVIFGVVSMLTMMYNLAPIRDEYILSEKELVFMDDLAIELPLRKKTAHHSKTNRGDMASFLNPRTNCKGFGKGTPLELELLVMLRSSPSEYALRNLFRTTWANKQILQNNALTLFVMHSSGPEEIEMLVKENSEHNDIIINTIQNTTIPDPFVSSVNWANQFCHNAKRLAIMMDYAILHYKNAINLLDKSDGKLLVSSSRVHANVEPVELAIVMMSQSVATRLTKAVYKHDISDDQFKAVSMVFMMEIAGVIPTANQDYFRPDLLSDNPCKVKNVVLSHQKGTFITNSDYIGIIQKFWQNLQSPHSC
ncbi:lactosylceramide 1,3-N-acetyl-beta-D-glucosaminyltransferase-like [Saccoglossus kowalevskii]